ncbi:MAG TPA: hypothetical protein VIV09_02660 [Pseudolabrys sp.]|jgi:hypothetical protein
MTFVLLECHYREGRWFASADGRLTDADGPILERAPKLFSLPVRVFATPGQPEPPKRILFQHSIGLAYAGSSLTAASIYAFASTACQSLMLKDGGEAPSLQMIAELVGRIAKHYIGEVWGRHYASSNRGKAELFVFGYCRKTKALQAFRITPVIETSFRVDVAELEAKPGAAYWLAPQAVKDAFIEETKKYSSVDPKDRPAMSHLLESIVLSNRYPEVGGQVQSMLADKTGAWVLPILRSADRDITNAKASFLDIDVNEIGPVGDCTIGVFADATRVRRR